MIQTINVMNIGTVSDLNDIVTSESDLMEIQTANNEENIEEDVN